MKISLNWLKQYVNLPKNLSPQELALKLTMATVEVEDVVDEQKRYENMVVGEILEIVPHPQADKLKVLKVKAGKNVYQVICGASNIYKGMKGVLALPGALVKWRGQGELVKLDKTNIRNVESEGMFCAPSEIGLADEFKEEDGLPDMPDSKSRQAEVIDLKESKSGENIASVLGLADTVLEIDNKSLSNRPDLWGHYGLAREVAALYGAKLKDLEIAKFKEESQIDLKVKVEDIEGCPRYLGVVIDGITIQPSPFWLKQLLQSAGTRPINNIVDITNYVMLELGQPLHVFDRKNIAGDTIIVKKAKVGETFITLDSRQRKLDENILMINDSRGPVAIAGIMGGENSEVTADTTAIILESANFNPVSIRKSALRLGLRTEASTRFEKSLDPNLAELAIKRAITLIKEIIPQSQVASRIADASNSKVKDLFIDFDLDFLKRRIGQEIPKKEVIKILESLAFEIKDLGAVLKVKVPTFRATKDVTIPEDLVEEVARIYGYGNIQAVTPQVLMLSQEENRSLILTKKVKDILTLGSGATEVYNYSFTGLKNITALSLKPEDHYELENYLSEDFKYLRLSLFENLVKNLESNWRFSQNFNIFELGRVFTKGVGEYAFSSKQQFFLGKQERILAGLAVGQTDMPFYQVKGLVETLLKALEIEYSYSSCLKNKGGQPSFVSPERYLEFKVGDEILGWVAELNPGIADSLDINKEVGLWQLSFELLLKYFRDNKKYQPLPKFPGMVYDFSIVVPENSFWGEIREEVMEAGKLIQRVELFDIFQLEKMGPNKKSLAFHVYFLDETKTLTSAEADSLRDKIINLLKKKFKAEIR